MSFTLNFSSDRYAINCDVIVLFAEALIQYTNEINIAMNNSCKITIFDMEKFFDYCEDIGREILLIEEENVTSNINYLIGRIEGALLYPYCKKSLELADIIKKMLYIIKKKVPYMKI